MFNGTWISVFTMFEIEWQDIQSSKGGEDSSAEVDLLDGKIPENPNKIWVGLVSSTRGVEC